MKKLKMSIIAFAVVAAVFAASVIIPVAGETSAEGQVVGYILENIIECS